MARQQLPPQIRKREVVDRRSGKPVVRYELVADAGTDPETGKRRQVRRRFTTEKAAREALVELSGQVADDAYVPRKAVTVDELCSDWLGSLHNVRGTTRSSYEYNLAPVREQLGEIAAQKLTRRHVDELIETMRKGGSETANGRTRKPWSARSVNKMLENLVAVLDYGVERRELGRNVAEKIKKLPLTTKKMDTYTPAEIRKVLAKADGHRVGQVAYLALSGFRRGEIAGLKWENVDLDAGMLTVATSRAVVSKTVADGAVEENAPKTAAARRTLPLDAGLVAVLKAAKKRQAVERLALGEAYLAEGYVVADEAGRAYFPNTIGRLWHEITDAAGVRQIRLHDARHSAATAMHLRGVPMAVIAYWIGHSDASFTQRTYAHSQDDEQRKAAASLGAVVTSCDIEADSGA
ncbi:integrase [Tsukamurella pulmonis]|nr:integrase [Tsukamurella pulmonis]